MGIVIAGMTMSLDGFVADREGDVGLLYPDFSELQRSESMRSAIEETGAVLMGRQTFEMADPDSYAGAYEFQVPIFVLTHHPPRSPLSAEISRTRSPRQEPPPGRRRFRSSAG